MTGVQTCALPISKEIYIKPYHSWAIPGFRGRKISTKLTATALYIFLLVVIACCNFDISKPWSFMDIFNKILILGLFMIIIVFSGNYKNIWEDCVLQKSEYWLLRIFGRVLCSVLIVFAWILFMSLIVAIFKLG